MKPLAVSIFIFVFALSLAVPAAHAGTAPSAAANSAFLAANAQKSGVVVLPSGLQYRVLHSGIGPALGPNDAARIAYTTRLIDGTLVDGTSPGLPVTVGTNGVIQGLGEALRLMHQGDHWQLVVPTALAFGPKAHGPVPANQTLVLDLTMVAVAPAASTPPADSASSFSILANGRQQGGTLTFHP